MAEQTAIITSADVTGRLSTQAYARLFAKNGGATADTTFRDLIIAEANSEIRVLLRAAFPDTARHSFRHERGCDRCRGDAGIRRV